jgi:hypothetical protein
LLTIGPGPNRTLRFDQSRDSASPTSRPDRLRVTGGVVSLSRQYLYPECSLRCVRKSERAERRDGRLGGLRHGDGIRSMWGSRLKPNGRKNMKGLSNRKGETK